MTDDASDQTIAGQVAVEGDDGQSDDAPPSDFAEAEAGAEDWPGPIEDEPPLFST